MRRRRPSRPAGAYESLVTALWPQLGDDHPHQYALDSTYNRLVGARQYNLQTGEWEPIPASTTRPLLLVACDERHHRSGSPMLAELWNTDLGPFFVAALAGAVFDPPDHPTDPWAPPTAVLSNEDKQERGRLFDASPVDPRWQPIPITVVRLFPEVQATTKAELWVKCPDHGAGTVDRVRLGIAFLDDQRRRKSRDTPDPTVVGLHDVGALFFR